MVLVEKKYTHPIAEQAMTRRVSSRKCLHRDDDDDDDGLLRWCLHVFWTEGGRTVCANFCFAFSSADF